MAFDASSLSPAVLKNLVSAVAGGSSGGLGGLLGGASALLGAAKGGDIAGTVIKALNNVFAGGGLSDLAKNAFTGNVLQGLSAGDVAKKLGVSEADVTSNVGNVISLVKAEFAKLS